MIWLALALSAAAAAKKSHGSYVIPPGHSAEFHLKATNGYKVSVSAGHGDVYLIASKGSGSVTYLAHGVTSSKRIEATFGDLGSVAVSFHPSGSPQQRKPEEGCRGRGESVQRGRFVGTISFEGEQSYTTLNASGARGREAESFKQVCSEEGEERGSFHPALHLTLLLAGSKSTRTSFFAFKAASKGHPALSSCLFAASITERGQQLTIYRRVGAWADVDAFASTGAGKTPALATLSPPAPFSGTVTYEKAKGSPASWAGSLAVPFPGLGVVPLTGSDWKAQLNPMDKAGSESTGSFTGSFIGD